MAQSDRRLGWREEAAPCLFGERGGVKAGWLAGMGGFSLHRILVALSYASVPLGFLHTGEAPAKLIQGLCVPLAVQVVTAGYLWLWWGVGGGDAGCVLGVPWECQRVLLAVGPALMEALWWLHSHYSPLTSQGLQDDTSSRPQLSTGEILLVLMFFFYGLRL